MPRNISVLVIDGEDGKGERSYVLSTRSDAHAFKRIWASTEGVEQGQPFIATYTTWHMGYGETRRTTTPYNVQGLYEYAVNAQATHPGVVVPGPAVTNITLTGSVSRIVDIVQHGGYIYASGGIRTFKIDTSNDTVAETYVWPAGSDAGQTAYFNAKLYIPLGNTVDARELTTVNTPPTDDTFTTMTGVKAYHFLGFDDKIWRMYGGASLNAAATTPATSGNWLPATPYVIGDPGREATSMVRLGKYGFIGKPDGFYGFDEDGNAVDILPDVNNCIDADNGRGAYAWHGMIWIPHMAGLYRHIAEGASRNYGPERLLLNESAVAGRIRAGRGAGEWMYNSLDDGTDSWILFSRQKEGGEPGLGDLIMHPVIQLAAVQCRALLIDSIATTVPRFWFANGNNISYITLGTFCTPNIFNTNYRFATSGTMRIFASQEDINEPGVLKTLDSIEFQLQQASSTKTWAFDIDWDGAGNWKAITPAVGASGAHIFPIPPDAQKEGYRFQWRATSVNNSATTPPRLRKVVVRGHFLPRLAEVYEADILLQDTAILPSGRRQSQKPDTVRKELEALIKTGYITVRSPIDGQARKMLILSMAEIMLPTIQGQPQESVLRLRLGEGLVDNI